MKKWAFRLLLWIGVAFSLSTIIVIFKKVFGIHLGAIPQMILFFLFVSGGFWLDKRVLNPHKLVTERQEAKEQAQKAIEELKKEREVEPPINKVLVATILVGIVLMFLWSTYGHLLFSE